MRTLLFLSCCLLLQSAFGQVMQTPSGNNLFLQTMTGQPITTSKVTKFTDGTPFLSNEWKYGAIVLANGKTFRNEHVKLNLLEGKLHYKELDGSELVAINPVREVILENPDGGKPMKFVHGSFFTENDLGSVWLQELNEGPVRVYKLHKKDVKEFKAYSSATTELYVTDEKRYYLLSGNHLQKIKKLKDITSLLNTKSNELSRFIREEALKDKAEADMARLVEYYNSLTRQ
jgi:hypothetical protein